MYGYVLSVTRPVIGINISTLDGTLCDTNGTSDLYRPAIYSFMTDSPFYFNPSSDYVFPDGTYTEYIRLFSKPFVTVENKNIDMTYVVLRLDKNTYIRLSQGYDNNFQ